MLTILLVALLSQMCR